jgi:hypothetical protein
VSFTTATGLSRSLAPKAGTQNWPEALAQGKRATLGADVSGSDLQIYKGFGRWSSICSAITC